MNRFNVWALLGIIFTLSVPLSVVAEEKPFTFCYENQHFPPFVLGTEPSVGGMGDGIIVDYVNLVTERLELDIQFVRTSWKRCQLALRNGEVDGLFAFIYNDDRDKWSQFPKTNGIADDRYIHLSAYKVFVKNGSSLSWDGSSFNDSNATIQSVPGYVSDGKLQSMGYLPIVNLQPNDALPLVGSGRLDGYVIDELIGKSLLASLGLTDSLTPLTEPFMADPWYLVFSKQRYATDAKKIEEFWNVLKEIRLEFGEQIISRYLAAQTP